MYFLNSGPRDLREGPLGLITYIHEAIHIYDNIKSAGLGANIYYWKDSSSLFKVKLLKGYITSDIIYPLLPEDIRGNPIIKTYIKCTNNCAAQKLGIYGLIEEFNAISQHTKFLLVSYNYFDTCSQILGNNFWKGYLNCKNDSWLNFYYFSIFFSRYIEYIEFHQPEFYEKIIADREFIEVFSKIFNSFNKTLNELNCLEKKVIQKINKEKYCYPQEEEFNDVKKLAENEHTLKYLNELLKN